jgi:hypothetical protein
LHREIDMTQYQEPQAQGRTLRAVMGVAAAICVLGLASLVFVHAPDVALATSDSSAASATDSSQANAPAAPDAGWTNNVPSADNAFRGKGYVAPEEPIAQF